MNDRIAKVLDHKGRLVQTTIGNATVGQAVDQMNKQRIGSLVIVDGTRPIGIFTERDVLVRVIARGREPSLTLVHDVMTRDPITVRPDTTVEEAMQIVTDKRCRHLPVIDTGELCGLVSAGDLTSWVVRIQQRTIYDLHDYIRAA